MSVRYCFEFLYKEKDKCNDLWNYGVTRSLRWRSIIFFFSSYLTGCRLVVLSLHLLSTDSRHVFMALPYGVEVSNIAICDTAWHL